MRIRGKGCEKWSERFGCGVDSIGARNIEAGAVLLYDGECGLCNRLVRFLLRRETTGILKFAPLQGRFGQAALGRLGLPQEDFDSLVYLPDRDGDGYLQKTDGVVAVLAMLPGEWPRLSRGLALIPQAWRDFGYGLVARSRYALFGEYKPTPLPDPKWADRIID